MTPTTTENDVLTGLVELIGTLMDRIDALEARADRSDHAHVEQTVQHVGFFGAAEFWQRSPALLAIVTDVQGAPAPLN